MTAGYAGVNGSHTAIDLQDTARNGSLTAFDGTGIDVQGLGRTANAALIGQAVGDQVATEQIEASAGLVLHIEDTTGLGVITLVIADHVTGCLCMVTQVQFAIYIEDTGYIGLANQIVAI